MKIVLINPNTQGRDRVMLPVPPLSLASLAAVALEKPGREVEIWDHFAFPERYETLAKKLVSHKADLVGISCLTPADPATRAICKLYREFGGQGRIVLGGVHPTIFHREMLEDGVCDLIVRREGEGPFADLLDALDEGRALDEVQSLTFKDDNGEIVATPDKKQIKDLETIPFPAWECLAGGIDVYAQAPTLALFGRTLPIIGSRGCPRRCTFCGQEIFHKGLRVRSVEHILEEVWYLKEKFALRNFVFLDANFPITRKYGMSFCEAMLESGLHKEMGWSGEIKVDIVDRELLQKMAEAGCRNVEYGFEVGSENVLKETEKGTGLQHALDAMRWTREAGIHVFGLFMIGLPGETLTDIYRTYRFAKRLDCNMVKFNVTIPYPGSLLFEQHREELLASFDPETYNAWFKSSDPKRAVTVVPGGLSARTLIVIQRLMMLGYYLRPGILIRHIREGTLRPRDFADGVRFLFGGLAITFWKTAVAGIRRMASGKKKRPVV